ncbi:MAG: hypothetical protein ACOYMG_17510 [Candidatus Methylumidiphilus sp.]
MDEGCEAVIENVYVCINGFAGPVPSPKSYRRWRWFLARHGANRMHAEKPAAKAAFFLASEGGDCCFAKALRAGGKTGGIGQPFLAEQRASEGVGAASGMLPPEASGALMLSGHVA